MATPKFANIAGSTFHQELKKRVSEYFVQAKKLPTPKYIEVDRSGPDHAPIFTIEVSIETGQSAKAQAQSKRAASQDAAADLLGQLES